MEFDYRSRVLTYRGGVVATQGNMKLESVRLTVTFMTELRSTSAQSSTRAGTLLTFRDLVSGEASVVLTLVRCQLAAPGSATSSS